jgi:hypothetical protein
MDSEMPMAAFRLVSAEQAGPDALGILTPPGRRTVLILRPRALPWDLVLVQRSRQGPTTTFREFSREESEAATETLLQSLETCGGRVSVAPVPDSDGYHVRAEIATIPLIACSREPGQPYCPLVLAHREEAENAAAALRDVLCPAEDAGQELYFNRRHFAH